MRRVLTAPGRRLLSSSSAPGSKQVSPQFRSFAKRQAVSDVTVTVFGATGFVGRNLVARLCKEGAQVVLPFRGDGMRARHLRVMGDLGQVVHLPFDPRDPETVSRAISGSNVVVNLIGSNFEPFPAQFIDGSITGREDVKGAAKRVLDLTTRSFTFDEVHASLPRDMARMSRDLGVSRFVHFSALGAHVDSPSRFLASKAKGEAHVAHEFPGATIMRPATVYGHDDFFLNRFSRMAWGQIPRGVDITTPRRTQPVHVEDVARATTNALSMAETEGETYELGGPETFDFGKLVEAIQGELSREIPNTHTKLLPTSLFTLYEELVLPRMLMLNTYDLQVRDGLDAVVSKHARKIDDLGVTPTPLEDHFERLLFKWKEDKYDEGWIG